MSAKAENPTVSVYVEEVFRRLAQANTFPTTELIYRTPYQLLVAVILSAQSTDRGVNRVTESLFAVAPIPEAVVRLGEAGLLPFLKTLGLYRAKSKNVIAMSKQLLDQHQGRVPNNRQDLEALPGVGRKTANVVLNTLFQQPVIAVDTHVFRVARRLGFSRGTTVAVVEKDLMKIVPPAYLAHAHHWLILLGRYQCTARSPKCESCLLNDICSKKFLTQHKSQKPSKKSKA